MSRKVNVLLMEDVPVRNNISDSHELHASHERTTELQLFQPSNEH